MRRADQILAVTLASAVALLGTADFRALADQDRLEDAEVICMEKEDFSGCCSWFYGVKGYDGQRFLCREGVSPTCKTEAAGKIAGCCSHNGGFDYAELDGTVFCKAGTISSCKLSIKRASCS